MLFAIFGLGAGEMICCGIILPAVAITIALVARKRFKMSGKSLSGLIMLGFGILGTLVSIAILVATTSGSPNIRQEQRAFLIFVGWGSLFVNLLLTIGGSIVVLVPLVMSASRQPPSKEQQGPEEKNDVGGKG